MWQSLPITAKHYGVLPEWESPDLRHVQFKKQDTCSCISTFRLPTDYFQTIAQMANNAGCFGLHWTFFWNRFFVFFLKTILLFFYYCLPATVDNTLSCPPERLLAFFFNHSSVFKIIFIEVLSSLRPQGIGSRTPRYQNPWMLISYIK